MDSHAHKFQVGVQPVAKRAPAECHSAEVEHDGLVYSLVLVRQYYAREGQASLEVVTAERTADGEPARTEFLEGSGQWTLNGRGGPLELAVDISTPENMGDAEDAIMNALLEQLREPMGADVIRSWP